MLANKKISVDEAERLISLIQPETKNKSEEVASSPKYLHVVLKPTADAQTDSSENVNVRVPMSFLRAGIKLTSLIPASAYEQVNSVLKERGIDFDVRSIKPENIQELFYALNDIEVDIQNGAKHLHIYTE